MAIGGGRVAKLVNFDEYSDNRFEDITNGERPPGEVEDPVDEETVLEPSSDPHETHPTGVRRVTGKTTIAADDPDQVLAPVEWRWEAFAYGK